MTLHCWRISMVSCVLFLGGLAPQLILAAPVVINFEGLGHRAAVLAQFENQGISFNRASCIDYVVQPGYPAGYAHSGTKGIEQCFAQEFCSVPIEMTFTAGQRRVKAWVGVGFPNQVPFTVHLRAFTSTGVLAREATVVLPPQNQVGLAHAPIEVVAASALIRKATISLSVDGQPAFMNSFTVDDVEFDTQGPAPPCGANTVPALTWVEPTQGFTTQIGSYLFQGSFTTEEALKEASLEVTSSTGSYTMDLLSGNWFPLNGGNFGPIRVSPLFPGTNQLTLRLRNCKGTTTLQRNVIYNKLPDNLRFALDRFEVTQTIQDLDHTVPLIAGKRTVARAYVRLLNAPGVSVSKVRGKVFATRPDGSPVGGPLTISSSNLISLTDNAAIGPRRSAVDGTLNFQLPWEWIREGKIHLELTQISVEGVPMTAGCNGCSNTTQFGTPRTVEFEEAPPLKVVLWSVGYERDGAIHDPRLLDFQLLESWLRRAYPTGQVQFLRKFLAPFDGTPGVDFDCDDVNARLHRMRTLCVSFGFGSQLCVDTAGADVHWYGMVSDIHEFMRGCSRGIPSRVASGPAGDGTFGWDNDGSYADWYGGHELAHTYGRKHPGFCGSSDDDDDYPYAGGKIGGAGFGFDVGDPLLGIPTQVYSPGTFTDVMTYCDFQWMSDYTYEGILENLRDISGSGGSEGSGAALLADALFVQGEILPDGNSARLRPFLKLSNVEETPDSPDSPFHIELRSSTGGLLIRRAFEPVKDVEALPGELSTASFDLVLPWSANTRRIVILKNGREFAARDVSTNAPQVRLVAPNGPLDRGVGKSLRVTWIGSDRDGDALTYTLLYSADNGQTWEPIESGLGSTELDVPLGRLRGTTSGLFRILATDGVNTTTDDQDAPMSISNKRPTATILSPAQDTQFAAGQAILLEGEGIDLEDGNLQELALIWRSSSLRSLGKGSRLSLAGLPAGRHTLTLEAEDSAGATGVDMVEIEVLGTPAAAVAQVEEVVTRGSRVALDGRNSTGDGALTFLWKLVSAPTGSTATVGNQNAALATFVPDKLGVFGLELTVSDASGSTSVTRVFVQAVNAVSFVRGEVTGDRKVDISDPVRILGWLFTGDTEPSCLDAADSNDDGHADLSDAVAILSFLFGGAAPPAPPFGACGVDPTGDELGCNRAGCP